MYAANLDRANQLEFFGFGWRYYNSIKNKAMEREFSWTGLLVSLSIAFFIVIVSSLVMSYCYLSVTGAGWYRSVVGQAEPAVRTEAAAPRWQMMVVNGVEMPRVETLYLG